MNGIGAGRARSTLTEEDAVLGGQGRGALLAAEAAHGAGMSRRRHRDVRSLTPVRPTQARGAD